ncbi:chondroitin proteoglycan 1-like [Clytia hemisphaerica]|uniref:Chitin-binding type-2 domain-containing protein n=1 Tax=Clytia hemisphaerica TaxID=252671 RepID=A0A7M5XAW1_9CNID
MSGKPFKLCHKETTDEVYRNLQIMKIIILAALVAACSAAPHSHDSCPHSLCKWRKVGDIFAYSEHKPAYFVTCSNTGTVCRRCVDGLIFNEKFKACVRPLKKTTTTTTTTTTAPTTTTTTTQAAPTTTTTTSQAAPTKTTRAAPTKTTRAAPTKTGKPKSPKCDDYLCVGVKNGELFRLDNNMPQYYVQCSNGFASCRQCPAHMYFNNKFSVCVRQTVPRDW